MLYKGILLLLLLEVVICALEHHLDNPSSSFETTTTSALTSTTTYASDITKDNQNVAASLRKGSTDYNNEQNTGRTGLSEAELSLLKELAIEYNLVNTAEQGSGMQKAYRSINRSIFDKIYDSSESNHFDETSTEDVEEPSVVGGEMDGSIDKTASEISATNGAEIEKIEMAKYYLGGEEGYANLLLKSLDSNDVISTTTITMGSTANSKTEDEVKDFDSESNASEEEENEAMFEDIEQVATEVHLGSVSFIVCSEHMLCKNRCGFQNNKQRATIFSEDITEEKKTYLRKRRHTENTRKFEKFEKIEDKHNGLIQSVAIDRKYVKENARRRWKRSEEMSKVGCGQAGQNETCFCDEVCVLYGDCCVDVFQSCFARNELADILNFITEIKIKFDLNSELGHSTFEGNIIHNFILSFATCEKIEETRSMFLVSRCPTWLVDTPLKKKCENSNASLLPPVTVTLTGGDVTFKNVYCAQCHDMGVDKLNPWLVQLDCDVELIETNIHFLTIQEMNSLVDSGACNVTFRVPSGICEPRHCEPDNKLSTEQVNMLIDNARKNTCTGEEVSICQTYYLPRNGFKNPTCEICFNSMQPTLEQRGHIDMCNVSFPFKNPNGFPIIRDGDTPLIGGILIILDINGQYSEKDKGAVFYVCDDNEVYDPFTLECKTLLCLSGFEPYRGKCVQSTNAFIVSKSSQIFPSGWDTLDVVTSTTEAKKYISCDEVLVSSQVKIKHAHFSVDKILINDFQEINGVVPENSSTTLCKCEEYVTKVDQDIVQSVDLIVSLTHEASIDTIDEITELAESIMSLRSEDDTEQIIVSNMLNLVQPAEACRDGWVLTQKSDFSLEEHMGVLYAVFNFTNGGVYYHLNSVGYEFTLKVSTGLPNNMTVSKTVYICQENELLYKTNCSVVSYWLNETQQNGSGLLIQKSDQYFEEGDFYIVGEKVFVCSNFGFKIQTKYAKNSQIYFILSCFCTIGSDLFLLIMLILYCLFPELRTLPGKMMASLAGTMMLTFSLNFLTMFDIHHDYICPVMAAISHVVTLSHFGWMSAIAFNMALTFGPGTNTLVKSHNDSKTFIIYNVIVWGISLSVVITAVVLDLTHRVDNNIENTTPTSDTTTDATISSYPRYGDPFCTWFSGPLWTKLAFIVIPYFITYIISVTGFILTLIGIRESYNNSEKIVGKKTSEKTRCLIYIKLSTAMGFSWILSILVNVYPEIEVLPYIYICLVLLQGVLLFLGFMANKKVSSLVMQKYLATVRTTSKDGTKISIIMADTL